MATATDSPKALPNDVDYRRAVLEKRLATDEEVVKCEQILDKLRRNNPLATLSQVFIEHGIITKSQFKRIEADLARQDGNSNAAVPQSIPGYEIQSKLGAGAMAVVYKARQIALDRVVAIKVLPKRLSANAEFVDRFYKEGKAAAKLNHTNIVSAIDVGQEPGGFHYFVMEYVEGVTVYDELEKGPYEEKEALRLCLHVAKALDHAHEKGFIHRDVKPKNIMVSPDRTAKLADMGLARAKDDIESAQMEKGRAYGTPYYIAPEQIRGEVDIDFRADIYSLGATLYHMVTGKVPFDGATPTEVMRKHLKEKLVPPDHIMRNLSTGIGEVIELMMAKKREDRYSSTKELLQDLEAISQGNPPLQARQRFSHNDLQMLADPEAGVVGGGHAASLNSLHAEYKQKLASLQNRFWMVTGVAGVLALWHVVNLIRMMLSKS